MKQSARIQSMRQSLGWSCRELSLVLGVAERTIARWESGEVEPTGLHSTLIEHLLRIDHETCSEEMHEWGGKLRLVFVQRGIIAVLIELLKGPS